MTSLKILVAEDEPLLAMLLEDVLEEMGHEICAIVSSEDDVIAASRKHRPDIMIIDPGLARGSGISAVTEILRTVFIPHIFVSGDRFWDPPLDPRAIVLLKPFRESDLADAIQRAMGATGT